VVLHELGYQMPETAFGEKLQKNEIVVVKVGENG
jgi:hypothetical protein